jgi:diguanylate cyclase (GGDEF)-like protein
VEGLLVVWQPHEGPQAVALRAALHDGAAALGAALARRRELEVLRRRCPEDLLTGSFSARAFAERLEEEVDRARRYGVALGLVLTDVDHMEALNQRHGRPAGDAALAALADLLRAQARRFDALGRTGGDELAWLLPETDAAAALRCGERLRRAVAAHAFPRVGRLSVSAGAASLPRLASDAAELREAAERSLALAKKCGRNRVGPGAPTAVH